MEQGGCNLQEISNHTLENSPQILWKPQPQQAIFMSRPEDEVLYGGAAGGGKSDALVAEALRQVEIPHYKGLILRKTYPQLSELIEKSMKLYPRVYPEARYSNTSHQWTFKSGAKIVFGSLNRTSDKHQYQGKAFDFIGFDELTHFTYDEYIYLMSRNRPNGKGTWCYIRATANPGGIGHGWVKSRFISPAPPMTRMKAVKEIVDLKGNIITQSINRIFVPATVFDNHRLLENDPNYLSKLASMPEAEKNALLYGDWNSFSGQVFTEWVNDSRHYDDRQYTHVIAPFKIPPHWLIYRGFDFGYTKPYSVGWYAVDTSGCIYRIRELYGCTGIANQGVRVQPQAMAEAIKEIEESDPNLKGRDIIGIADPSIFDKSRGESVADMMESRGIFWSGGDNTRIPGKMQYHYRLAFDDQGLPMFYVFNTCKHFIRTLPNLVYSESNVEDVDTTQEDHIYDECRYVLMENPISPRRNYLTDSPKDDPLNMLKKEKNYSFYNG